MDLQPIISTVCSSLIPMAITGICTFITTKYYCGKAVRYGLQALLRDRMLQAYERYQHREPHPYVTVQEKQNFLNMYTCYHNLGFNGVMTEIFNEVLGMSTIPQGE